MTMVLEATDRSQRFQLDQTSVFVGSCELKSDICLHAPNIAEVHCELVPRSDGVRVVAFADAGVTVNGHAVREAVLLNGDVLGIGPLRFRLVNDEQSGNYAVQPITAAADADDLTECEPSSGTHYPSQQTVQDDTMTMLSPEQSRWMIRMSGLNLGPLDWDELQSMISRGEVRLEDLVQREHERQWQPVRDVLMQSHGDACLCDDSPPKSEVQPQSRSRSRRRRKRRSERDYSLPTLMSDSSAEMLGDARRDSRKKSRRRSRSSVVTDAPLPPQFFILRGQDELGPLPRKAIQELADSGSIHSDTPVRLEDEAEWSTAAAVGFRCRARQLSRESVQKPSEQPKTRVGGAMWLLLAPGFYVAALAESFARLEPRRRAMWAAMVLAVGFVAFGWIRLWSQTAMTGVVTFEGELVPSAVVTLTGATTGDSGVGVTGSDGAFRIVTLDGELKPGLYLVTVRPMAEPTQPNDADSADIMSEIPDRYRHLNTTDAMVEISASRSEYAITLTQHPTRPAGFRGVTLTGSDVLP